MSEAIQTGTLISVAPTKCWIEKSFTGDKKIFLQHEGCEPFQFITVGYDYRYTSNGHQYDICEQIVRSLGFEPVWK